MTHLESISSFNNINPEKILDRFVELEDDGFTLTHNHVNLAADNFGVMMIRILGKSDMYSENPIEKYINEMLTLYQSEKMKNIISGIKRLYNLDTTEILLCKYFQNQTSLVKSMSDIKLDGSILFITFAIYSDDDMGVNKYISYEFLKQIV